MYSPNVCHAECARLNTSELNTLLIRVESRSNRCCNYQLIPLIFHYAYHTPVASVQITKSTFNGHRAEYVYLAPTTTVSFPHVLAFVNGRVLSEITPVQTASPSSVRKEVQLLVLFVRDFYRSDSLYVTHCKSIALSLLDMVKLYIRLTPFPRPKYWIHRRV